ncbi:MAG: 2-polyprenyl-6-methoxyphenol hydroxylase [Rhodospirillaceae bacterium]|nr:2-polyprenyl-6-methoxyphenol hydroxylase [Rhodospirillaceae bacterium]MBT4590074.1 2-polyprenyl-6-methoxyphenol hydroxylase [Rhodospirillaceae bacterium]MBT4937654.1 2-polyprenyl-6-methoxyphenol hydroxylase [Rhodospirillaceae bacterium]MBT7268561.1 2-polyprenyl-6-methoxyphenol hydroxylase [Rhodospirillaceae bacterium]
MDTKVLIVGAGPVGLTLAIDLGQRGIDCVLIEQKEAPEFQPKMERCNARTMEIYRRMGLADKIRAAGLSSDIPMDVFIVTTLDKPPLIHHPYPSVDAARQQALEVNDGTLPLEPYQLISQYTLEPLLKEEAEKLDSVQVTYGCKFIEFEQNGDGVTTQVEYSDGRREQITATYMVGCDGGTSNVRKQLDIKLRGEGNISQLQQALFRCDDLYDKIPMGDGPGKGRHYHVADERATFLIMQDSTKHFTLHSKVENEEEMKAMFERTIALPLDYELINCNPWRQNLLVADRYRRERVFLAGDAVHLVIPTGGLGMNTGVGDAIDLSWKLAATLEGWGGENLLNSYEVERRQIGDRNVGASRFASSGRRIWRSMCGPIMFEETPEGEKSRADLIKVAEPEHKKTNDMIGAELGYRYVGSPIIWEEPGGPEHLFRTYEPTSWAGARLPHVRLDDGTALQDILPNSYVLLCLSNSTDGSESLAQAFADIGAPFNTLAVDCPAARALYQRDFILIRTDLHIVWRGNEPHEDPKHLAHVATGYRTIEEG